MRIKKIVVTTDTLQLDTLQLDTLSIIPNSLIVQNTKGKSIDTSLYSFNPFKAELIWEKQPTPDTILTTYRVYPFSVFTPDYHKKFDLQKLEEEIVFGKYTYQVKREPIDVFDLGNMNYNGSFSRGISVGSNQDLVVNSNFNLQLQGKLKNDVMVRAAIMDNNIPFQAQGNTQQLQEFDRIFIELSKDKSSLIVGDYDLKRPQSYFMNFYKRLQGVSGQSAFKTKRGKVGAKAAVAVARGQYNRMSFQGVEGNQGPYKLLGANGESFIIILSGSERVYIDGQLLTRGYNNDYIIDYNLGEITFTPYRLITKDVRIVIEFEYSAQNYLRSLMYGESYFKNEKWEIATNFYSEQDAKNQPLLQDLTGEQKDFLVDLGDNINQAFFSGIDSVGYNEERNLYAKKDIVVNNINYTYYAYSQNPDSAIYALSFSNVGLGNGNYILLSSGVNGRIYEWVAPDDLGNLQGNFEPVILLITPKKKQLFTTKAVYNINEKSKLNAEIGLSNFDQNTFSKISDANDKGVAAMLEWEQNNTFKKNNNWNFTVKAKYEFVQKNFVPLEAYRPIEFTRDWNSTQLLTTNHEHLPTAFIQFKQKNWGLFNYSANAYIRPNEYQGIRHVAQNKINSKGFEWDIVADYLKSDSEIETTNFFRPKLNLIYQSKKIKNWKIGLKANQEKNSIRLKLADTLSNNSFYFNVTEFFIASPTENANQLSFNWQQRWDYGVSNNAFNATTYANTFNLNGAFTKKPKNRFSYNITYRKLDILNNELTEQQKNATLLGEFNYFFEAFKGLLRSTTNYKLGSGQKQVVEYEYTAVTNGLGTHVWNDLNDNGLKEIDEFRLIFENEFPDTTYIQISIPSNLYTPTKIAGFSQNINLTPKLLLFNKKRVAKWLGYWEYQGFIELERHFPTDSSGKAWNFYLPGNFHLSQEVLTLVVSERSNYRNSLFYNRTGKLLSGELFYNIGRNKDLLVNGFIENQRLDRGVNAKSKLNKQWILETKFANGFTSYNSIANQASNYHINYNVFEPSIKFQKNNKWSVTTTYRYKKSKNVGGEQGLENNGSMLFKYSIPQKGVFDVKLSYINISYNGNIGENFNLENQILQGLQTGANYVWNVGFRTKISKNIELNLSYNGKKSDSIKLQNTGKAQITALF